MKRLAFALLVVLLPLGARADDREGAAREFRAGVRAYDRGEYNEAIEHFERSRRLQRVARTLYNLAQAQRALRRYGEAIRSLERYLEEARGQGREAGTLARARDEIRTLRRLVAQLTVVVDQPGATVTVDGREAGVTPLRSSLLLAPGRHTIEVRLDRHRTTFREVELIAAQPAQLRIRLEPLRDPATLVLSSDPEEAGVTIDGVDHVLTPWVGEIQPGRHVLELTADGYFDEELEITVAPNQRRRVHVPMSERTVWRSPWFWTITGVVVAGAAVGLWFVLRPEPENVAGNFDPPIVRALEAPP